MIKIQYLLLIIAASSVPILLPLEIYFDVDCTTQTQKNYKAWLDMGNKGTFNDMVNSCNTFHPLILVMIMPCAPIIFIILYRQLNVKPSNGDVE